jgi:ribose transport system ATP-binding protein
VAEHGEGVIVPHVEDDPRYYSGVDARTGLWLNAVLAVPLKVKQRVIGVLEVVDATGGRFTPANQVLVEAMASIAAVAIENASLFGQTRQDAEVKATLLREVNHRVKNNLVSIMGLLSMERAALFERDSDPKAILSQLEERIGSMLTVHEMLSAVHWSPLRLRDLLGQVVGAVLDGSPLQAGVEVHVSIGPDHAGHEVWLEPQEATGLALIVNELAINSLKHAFDGRDHGRIDLQIESAMDREEVVLVYRDDGPGWPDDVLAGQRENIGLGLVRGVVRSPLRGQIELSNHDGAVARIAFRPAAAGAGKNGVSR